MPVTLHRMVDEAAMRRPDGDAARCDGAGLTWQELAVRVNGVARALLDTGVRRGDRVAVLLGKSLDVPAAFYGVLAAGGALVPIDPKSPVEQISRILRATGATRLVTEPGRRKTVADLLAADVDLSHTIGLEPGDTGSVPTLPWSAVDQLASDRPLVVNVGGLDTSYVLHTSGSTGEPKLIRHTHSSALAFVEWAVETYGLRPDDRLSNHSSHHTCFATFDFYAAARAAATTVILTPAAMLMPASLAQVIEGERVSIWYSVPTALVQLLLRGNLEERNLASLRWVLFAGETFPEKHLHHLRARLPSARFSHVYGSTEVNVCTYYHLPEKDAAPSPLPIGRPCSNTEALVVDDALEEVTGGGTGELLIRGSTVMSGYWGDPDRNRRVLVRRPAPGGFDDIYFRTGDRVRTLSDGNLTFAGRADLQVKVRGYRVELEEVETALLGLAPVHEAAAFAVSDGEGSSIVRAAVVVDPNVEVTQKSLLDGLKTSLPLYAVPSEIEILSSLPRTPTGKVDRKKLVAALADDGETHA
ncbi:MAG: amino acid adenylation domain-containing protein [Thermoanaerobaculales bacterium]|jgi:amino acid adenylation domain-containing protein|nr:amino acid adenylation domain-containing protein [Thermoanaerobaculales bacterium]